MTRVKINPTNHPKEVGTIIAPFYGWGAQNRYKGHSHNQHRFPRSGPHTIHCPGELDWRKGRGFTLGSLLSPRQGCGWGGVLVAERRHFPSSLLRGVPTPSPLPPSRGDGWLSGQRTLEQLQAPGTGPGLWNLSAIRGRGAPPSLVLSSRLAPGSALGLLAPWLPGARPRPGLTSVTPLPATRYPSPR